MEFTNHFILQIMKKELSLLIVAMSLLCSPVFIQAQEDSTAMLGLAGDNLDLYAVLTLFQKSKTIEAFEKTLNDEQTKINNLDLNLDKKVDFIKVTTTKKDSAFSFVLQVDVTKTETQDVAIILVNKDKGKVSIQAVGDEELYGKDYVIEPKGQSSVTANPGYTGADPVIVNVPATTTIVVQSAPIVQYVYSPAYVPYYPPYAYGYYPPYFAAFTVMAVGIYRHNNYYHHGGYYGGHYHGGNNTVIINDRDNFNNYNNNRDRSNTVADNKARGNYDRGNGSSGRGPSASTRPTAGTSNRPGGGASASQRPTTNPGFNRSGTTPSASTNNLNKSSNRSSSGSSFSSRPSTSNLSSSGRSRSSGGFSGGGGGR